MALKLPDKLLKKVKPESVTRIVERSLKGRSAQKLAQPILHRNLYFCQRPCRTTVQNLRESFSPPAGAPTYKIVAECWAVHLLMLLQPIGSTAGTRAGILWFKYDYELKSSLGGCPDTLTPCRGDAQLPFSPAFIYVDLFCRGCGQRYAYAQ